MVAKLPVWSSITVVPVPGPVATIGAVTSEDAQLGPNSWLVEEMYDLYQANPEAVDESWRDYFEQHGEPETPREPEPQAVAAPEPVAEPPGEPLRGVAARIVENMEASLSVPTATSYRQIPARLLEVNRQVINGYLGRTRGGKVSFTHIIAYAVVRAVAAVPAMGNVFATGPDGEPRVIRNEHVGLGLAVDVQKRDGSRSLLVPCVKNADTLGFREFVGVYDDLVSRVLASRITPDDFTGATMSLTNVGTIGTLQSVPRLMPGQSAIVGVGAIGYPAEFQGSDPSTLAEMGVGKVITVSDTYDHRVIQGAESGLFLKRVHELLLGADGFYEDLFESMGVPYAAVQWRTDRNPNRSEADRLEKQMQVRKIVQMYRVRGHLIADLDPLGLEEPQMFAELDPANYGLTIWDLDREFLTDDLTGPERMRFGDILRVLRDAYCRTIGVEYMHIQSPEEKAWVQAAVESPKEPFSAEEQLRILEKLSEAEAFEQFLHRRYVGHKRFGLDGAESTIPILHEILSRAADTGMSGAVLGMAHRGRLNVLTNIMGQSYGELFRQFEGFVGPDSIQGTGDVKYHLGASTVFTSDGGAALPVDLAANPSHLEAVDPVALGMVRAKQDRIEPPGSYPVLPVLVHGDAAFAGQGVVAETLNTSKIPGFRVGGTVHLVINNQVGYTATARQARSGTYATDVAKMVQAPIFHVNGDDPEACVRVARWAFDFRQAFHKDVVIDMVCYRRHGHNEGDDPSYTQPLMYRIIDSLPTARERYTALLVKRGDITAEQAQEELDRFAARMQQVLDETRAAAPAEPPLARVPEEFVEDLAEVDTSADPESLDQVIHSLTDYPEGFTVHPKLERQFRNRTAMYESGEVDWGLAETLAYGSLLLEGIPVRLTGQDSRRGTFAHRHAVVVDYETEREYVPLEHLDPDQAPFWCYDSMLSEYAGLGLEYGYSTVARDALVEWEAQFGDFVNGAQVIIDQFIAAGEDKWNQKSGLVMLLPHGYEGQGPEHSSARIERFLILCAEGNMTIAVPTTSAQFFHLLRRQVLKGNPRPLVVFTPKSLLRARRARSEVSELTSGSWRRVLDDPDVEDSDGVRAVALCSGKVAYDAMAHRDTHGLPLAVVRLEQLYPWPADEIGAVLDRYRSARSVIWLQEEPANMGGWNFVRGRWEETLAERGELVRVSRPESGSPACGSMSIHNQETARLMENLAGSVPR
ncbi:MAG TPA: multifunctional oxoglutarate decarboxylase/oxoglutarate dehydrogenase thiamine pyrophosphate-binding subunit/dihydrolipoyllysine-residue succinyltransferase subunit [Acidimicrobiales bacterium]|nr:multifunctional oxoglutarate decarboxylase/oxoglutarate dehydrogenase thiamine pyrophosphate-binding subunit/dihydrolipoyllysine-residue succinyltransferase subunit [Acidimicrobiales bacterium]